MKLNILFVQICLQLTTILAHPSLLEGPVSYRPDLNVSSNATQMPPVLTKGDFPSLPAGYQLYIDRLPGASMNPVNVYNLAITALVSCANRPWGAPATNFAYTSRFEETIYVQTVHPSLKNSHVMLGIYFGIMQTEAALFLPTVVRISISRTTLGFVLIQRRLRTLSSRSTLIASGTESLEVPDTATSSYADTEGEIVAPDDPTLAISYRHTGRRVDSKLWFRLIMQAAIIITYDGSAFDHLNALTEDGGLHLNIYTLGGHPDPKKIARSLLLLPRLGRRIDELEWTIKFGAASNRQPVAEGFFLQL